MAERKKPGEAIEGEVLETLALEKKLEDIESELMQNEKFRAFIEMQKTLPAQIAQTWDRIKDSMLENDIKSIKGDWGSITIAERTNWDIDYDQLPARYFQRVPNTKMISDTFKLTKKAPKGATPKYTKYLHKRIK